MKKKLKAMQTLTGATLGLAVTSKMGTALGTTAPGQLATGFTSQMGTAGSLMGAGMLLDMIPKPKRR